MKKKEKLKTGISIKPAPLAGSINIGLEDIYSVKFDLPVNNEGTAVYAHWDRTEYNNSSGSGYDRSWYNSLWDQDTIEKSNAHRDHYAKTY